MRVHRLPRSIDAAELAEAVTHAVMREAHLRDPELLGDPILIRGMKRRLEEKHAVDIYKESVHAEFSASSARSP